MRWGLSHGDVWVDLCDTSTSIFLSGQVDQTFDTRWTDEV